MQEKGPGSSFLNLSTGLMAGLVVCFAVQQIVIVHLGKPYSIHQQPWPKVDEEAAREDVIEIPVQVNGKLRDRITVPADASEADIQSAALASEQVQKHLEGKTPKKMRIKKINNSVPRVMILLLPDIAVCLFRARLLSPRPDAPRE